MLLSFHPFINKRITGICDCDHGGFGHVNPDVGVENHRITEFRVDGSYRLLDLQGGACTQTKSLLSVWCSFNHFLISNIILIFIYFSF